MDMTMCFEGSQYLVPPRAGGESGVSKGLGPPVVPMVGGSCVSVELGDRGLSEGLRLATVVVPCLLPSPPPAYL